MMATTGCSSPSDIEQDSPLQSAFSGIDLEKLAQDDRFLDRIAYVCQKGDGEIASSMARLGLAAGVRGC